MKEIKRHITRGSSIFIYSKKRLQEKILEWNKYFRNDKIDIVPYYAVKCNPKDFIIKDLIEGGIKNFDCASINEIKMIKNILNKTNNNNNKTNNKTNNNNNKNDIEEIIFAQPCKEVEHIKKSMIYGVNLYTFDCIDELYKINKNNERANIVLRLAVDDSNSICKFSAKYGAKLNEVENILYEIEKIRKINSKINFGGVSFHVGSGCLSAYQYVNAILDCYNVLNIAEKKYKYNPKIIDIGGGFNNKFPINIISENITDIIYKLNINKKYNFIAEPGRYFVENCADLYTKINTVKYDYNTKTGNIYITNGTYQDLNCVIYDHNTPEIIIYDMKKNKEIYRIDDKKKENYVRINIWGPTCDSMDKIGEYYIPEEYINVLREEDIILKFENMGAYTMAAGCPFNGYEKAKIIRE